MFKNFYYVFEVVAKNDLKSVEVYEDDFFMGFEPRATMEFKIPGKFSPERLVGRLHGHAALHPFKKGDLVAVSLSFRGYGKGDDFVNDIVIDEIKLVKDLDHQYL